MGEVWRARDARLGRDVALKLVPDRLAADSERLARLRREARLLASLNHPNIATLYEIEEAAGMPVLVMELVEGETLSARLRRGPLPLAEALGLAQQVAGALAAAHDRGILHRDFKPSNVLLSKTGRVKLLDFGLAKALDGRAGILDDDGSSERPTLSAKRTQEGTVMGTAPYMSPEQARGEPVDKRTDVWAFGCVLFEMLSGTVAFPGKSLAETMAAILGREPDWGALPDGTPLAVRRVLERCLRKNRDERLRDVGDAGLELQETDRAGASDSPPPRRLGPMLAMSLAAVAIVAAWLGTRANRQPAPDIVRLSVTLHDDERARIALWDEGRAPLAVSPDGRRLAYIAAGERGLPRVYVRELNAFQSKPLAGSDGSRCLFFSADGQWIGFQTSDGTVRKVSISGGAPIEIGRLPLFSTVEWGPDDRIVFGAGLPTRIWSAPASGGEPRRLGPPEERGSLVPHQRLSGGHMLASSTTPDGRFLEVVSLDDGSRRRLVQAVVGTPGARVLPSGHLVYAESGTLRAARFDLARLELRSPVVSVLEGVHAQDAWIHYFAVSDTGVLAYVAAREPPPDQLAWVDHAGAATPVPGGEAHFFFRMRLSPDGRRAAAALAEGTGRRIWVFDLERGTRRPISHEGETRSPVWSRDGRAVMFQSNRDESESVLSQLVDESARASLLLERPARAFPADLTPDGRSIAYEEESAASRFDIWVHTLGAGSSLAVTGAANERSPAFSPDGRWIAYTSDESGRPEVYLQPYPRSGGAVAVSASGGTAPRWAPDGKTIFYRSDRQLMAVPVQTEGALRLGEARALFEGSYRESFDVSPDGKRFLMLKQGDAAGINELSIVVNWLEELKRLVP
jgi:serine/threonine-protein kinase